MSSKDFILLRLCKLSIPASNPKWDLRDFKCDDRLDEIYPQLQKVISNGQKVTITGYYPTISIDDIITVDNEIKIVMYSDYDYDSIKKQKKIKKICLSLTEIEKFLDYVDKNNIENC